MLKLYHGPAAANGLKCLIALCEKGLEFEGVFVDLHSFEQHDPAYLAINPEGQVPALDHDGFVLNHSSVINEYLEDAFPDAPPLRPADAQGKARMRVWNKQIDELYMEAVSIHGWARMITPLTRKMNADEFEAHIARIPLAKQQKKWRAAREGFAQDDLDAAAVTVEDILDKVEAQLEQTPWLVGKSYTLADVNMFATGGKTLPLLFPQLLAARPHLVAWRERVLARPGVQAAFASAPPLPS